MKTKLAILQVADSGPLESIVVMLRSIGIECAIPDARLRDTLRSLGCDTVLDIEGLVSGMGYERPMPLPYAGIADMSRTNVLYVDIKAHRNGAKVLKQWPNLKDRVLWYRINGGKPEHVVRRCSICHGITSDKICPTCKGTGIGEDCGDEINPGCPVLTPNLWYKNSEALTTFSDGSTLRAWDGPQSPTAYACWPPFHRFDEYSHQRVHDIKKYLRYAPPICLIHGIEGWGYKSLIEDMRTKLGVKCYGRSSPDGLINHREVPTRLSSAVAMVHLKSNDAPGYALYEALAAACPVICTRRLIWRCRMQELLIPGKTCLVFDRETHDGLSQQDILECLEETKNHLAELANPDYNKSIGEAGRERLKQVMWSDKDIDDVESLKEFMQRNFK